MGFAPVSIKNNGASVAKGNSPLVLFEILRRFEAEVVDIVEGVGMAVVEDDDDNDDVSPSLSFLAFFPFFAFFVNGCVEEEEVEEEEEVDDDEDTEGSNEVLS